MFTTIFFVILVSLAVGAIGMFVFSRLISRGTVTKVFASSIAERIRAVGKLTGLEVVSKEIVTQTKGLKWLPPLIFSQARLAMIFHFEKQYFIDLSRLSVDDIRRTGPTGFLIMLPRIEGHLTLLDVIPYDIQSGKLLGLFDVFKMDAETQKEMMNRAQEEASRLYEENASRYEQEARAAIARQIHGLLELFDVEVGVRFPEEVQATPIDSPSPMVLEDDHGTSDGPEDGPADDSPPRTRPETTASNADSSSTPPTNLKSSTELSEAASPTPDASTPEQGGVRRQSKWNPRRLARAFTPQA